MKAIVFCGHRSMFGNNILKALIESRFEIIMVIFATEKRWKIFSERLVGKKYINEKKNIFSIIKKFIKRLLFISAHLKKEKGLIDNLKLLKEKGIPYKFIFDINDFSFIYEMKKLNPDLFFCAAYPQIFSKELISIPKNGSINFHPSLLPKFRGAHPHYWAIVKGEKESGITAHFMTEEIDKGDIIAQIKFLIDNLYYNQLYKKIIDEIPNIIKLVEDFFFKNKGKIKKQNNSKATFFQNDREIHHRIFWNINTANEIYNLIRGGNAFCFFRNKKIIISKAYLTDKNRNLTNNVQVENGTIVDLYKDAIIVKAEKGLIGIQEVIYFKKKFCYKDLIRKFNLEIGEKFE